MSERYRNICRRRFLKDGSAISAGVFLSGLGAPALCQTTKGGDTILIDAEAFEDPGGWVVDTQSIGQVGSAYLLAHGAGVHVSDASTTIELTRTSSYHIWVRTRDWSHPHRPGRFHLQLVDRTLQKEFGVGKADWYWQDPEELQLFRRKALGLPAKPRIEDPRSKLRGIFDPVFIILCSLTPK